MSGTTGVLSRPSIEMTPNSYGGNCSGGWSGGERGTALKGAPDGVEGADAAEPGGVDGRADEGVAVVL